MTVQQQTPVGADRKAMMDLALKRLMAKANEARSGPRGLIKFVMRDDRTYQRITRIPPHHSLMLDFVEDNHLCVVLMPPGFGKTSLLLGYVLFRIANDPTERWVYINGNDVLAEQFVQTARTYIEDSNDLHYAFPKLHPSSRRQDPWTKGAITVEREIISKDPSIRGVGLSVGIQGSRLTGIIVDDVLTQQNTSSKEQRDKIWEQHSSVWLHRLDPTHGRMIVVNTAWNEDDYPHRLMNSDQAKFGIGWPTLIMGVMGDVYVYNLSPDEWDSDELRPSSTNQVDGKCACPEGPYRLTANDRFAEQLGCSPENVPLWPDKYPPEWIEEKRSTMIPVKFNLVYEQKTYSGDSTHCPIEWIERCKQNGVKLEHYAPTAFYTGNNPVVMGVDLAVHKGEEFDYTCMATWEFMLDKDVFKLLDIESVQLKGPQIVRRIQAKAKNYKDCHVVVENVGAQEYLRQFLIEADEKANNGINLLNIRAHTTGGSGGIRKTVEGMRVNKWHRDFGVESLFVQVMNGKWILPCQPNGTVHPNVQRLIDGCIYYQPENHSSDELMASWFAITWGKQLVAYRKLGKGKGSLRDVSAR